jgi:hypothetical protein
MTLTEEISHLCEQLRKFFAVYLAQVGYQGLGFFHSSGVEGLGHVTAFRGQPYPDGTSVLGIGETFHQAAGFKGIHQLGNRGRLDPQPGSQVADPEASLR